jgi:hypothetical protein
MIALSTVMFARLFFGRSDQLHSFALPAIGTSLLYPVYASVLHRTHGQRTRTPVMNLPLPVPQSEAFYSYDRIHPGAFAGNIEGSQKHVHMVR